MDVMTDNNDFAVPEPNAEAQLPDPITLSTDDPQSRQFDILEPIEVKVVAFKCAACSKVFAYQDGNNSLARQMARDCCASPTPCVRCGGPREMVVGLYKTIKAECEPCKKIIEEERLKAIPRKPWNGHPLINNDDKLFVELGYATDDLKFDPVNPPPGKEAELREALESMNLFLTEPVFGNMVEKDHIFQDVMGEDYEPDLSPLDPFIDKLNEAILNIGPVSYESSGFRLDIAAEYPKLMTKEEMDKIASKFAASIEINSSGKPVFKGTKKSIYEVADEYSSMKEDQLKKELPWLTDDLIRMAVTYSNMHPKMTIDPRRPR